MIVVSDTSPLTNLASIGRLELLRDLYGKVMVPEAVAEEIRAGERRNQYPPFLATTVWLEVRAVSDRRQVDELLSELDIGEAEAIVLALEVGVHLLLVDERTGRRAAGRKGIRTVGLIGSILACKKRRLIPAVKPVLDELRNQAGFWISAELYARVLRDSGEQGH